MDRLETGVVETGAVTAPIDAAFPPPVVPIRLGRSGQRRVLAAAISSWTLMAVGTLGITPVYPDIARRARIEGIVIMASRIRKDGTIGSVHVLSTSNPMFNAAAITAVRQWRYSPGKVKGEVVEVPYAVRVDFRLK